MLILAVDPAIRGALGYVLLDSRPEPRLIDWRTLTPPRTQTWQQRLGWVGEQTLRQVDAYERHRPALAYEASWMGQNLQTTRKLTLVGGVVVGVALARGLAWCEVQPAEAKLALAGDSGADGATMRLAAFRQFGATLTEHEASALGVALHAAGVLQRVAAIAAGGG